FATNVIGGAALGPQIYVRDLWTNTTHVGTGEVPANAEDASISADGQLVAFISNSEVLVYDRSLDSTVRIVDRAFSPMISADGRFVTFYSGIAPRHAYLYELATGISTVISATTGGAGTFCAHCSPSISDDGRYVAFEAARSVPRTVRVFDRVTGAIEIVDGSTIGRSSLTVVRPEISGDGRTVFVYSYETGILDGYWLIAYDRTSGISTEVAFPVSSGESGASSSPLGDYVAFTSEAGLIATDGNGYADVYLATLETNAPPVADPNGPYLFSLAAGPFDGRGSSDPEE
ncbi:unnamed protein product, partial [marine sediment metagenome]